MLEVIFPLNHALPRPPLLPSCVALLERAFDLFFTPWSRNVALPQHCIALRVSFRILTLPRGGLFSSRPFFDRTCYLTAGCVVFVNSVDLASIACVHPALRAFCAKRETFRDSFLLISRQEPMFLFLAHCPPAPISTLPTPFFRLLSDARHTCFLLLAASGSPGSHPDSTNAM